MPTPLTPAGNPRPQPQFPSIVPHTQSRPFGSLPPAERKRISDLDKVFYDPSSLFINIPTAAESATKIGNFLMQLDQAKGGSGLNIHQPIGTDNTEFANHKYGIRIKSIRDFLDKTIGVVPADLFRLKYLSHVTKRNLIDPTLGPNSNRFKSQPGEHTDSARGGRGYISPDLIKRRTDAKHTQDIIDFLVKNKIRLGGIPEAVRDENGRLQALEGVDEILPKQNADGTPAQDDPELLDLSDSISFKSYVDLCRKYMAPEFGPVVEYANNVGNYAFMHNIDLMEKLGAASGFPMTHIGMSADAPAQHISMDTPFGELGHVEGYEEARKAYFLGKMTFNDGDPDKASMIFDLDTTAKDVFTDSATGEMTPQFREAMLLVDRYAKEVREEEASNIRGKSVEARKIVILTAQPMVNTASAGGEKKELPGVKRYEVMKPQVDEIVEVIIPEFLAQASKKVPFVSNGTPIPMIQAVSPTPDDPRTEVPTNEAKALAKKMSKFATGFSYLSLGEFLMRCATAATKSIPGRKGKNIIVESMIEAMKGNYTESLFKSVTDANGAQVKEQFEVIDIDQVKPENMRHPEQVMAFLENFKAMVPLDNLLDDPSATKTNIEELLKKLGMDPESFGWSETKWNNLTEEDLRAIKEQIKKQIEARSANFILFAGPGGMGKTTTAMFLAHFLDYGFMMWNMCLSKNKFVGDSEKNIAASFKFVSQLMDYVILLDEVDHCIAGGGGEHDGGTGDNLKGVFKSQMENVIAPAAKKNHLIIVSTTNHLDRLEGPIARRLGKDNTVVLDYIKDRSGVQSLADACIDRYAGDPAYDRLSTLKQPYAEALFREANMHGKGPYSNDEIVRMFRAWVDWNRTYVLKKFGKANLYKPETLMWVVQNSRRQSIQGSFTMSTVPDGIVTGQSPKEQAPDGLNAPGYSPVGGKPTQQQPPPPPPNPTQARDEAEDNMLSSASSNKKKVNADKGKIKLMSVADTLVDQQIGLKGLRSIPEMSGMLFRYQSPKVLSFWMQDTYIPLDIAFISDSGEVKKVAKMAPMSTKSVRSDVPCTMALEVSAGTLEKIGCSVGKKAVLDLAGKTVHFE